MPEFAFHPLQKCFHEPCLMSWVTIHNKKDRFFPTMHQTLEKFYKHRSLDSLAGDHESKLTFGANSRNHVERKSLAGLLDHRGLPDGCPGRFPHGSPNEFQTRQKKSLHPHGWPAPESSDTRFLPIARPTRGFAQTL